MVVAMKPFRLRGRMDEERRWGVLLVRMAITRFLEDQNIVKTNRASYNHKRSHNVTREDATRWNNNSKDGIYY